MTEKVGHSRIYTYDGNSIYQHECGYQYWLRDIDSGKTLCYRCKQIITLQPTDNALIVKNNDGTWNTKTLVAVSEPEKKDDGKVRVEGKVIDGVLTFQLPPIKLKFKWVYSVPLWYRPISEMFSMFAEILLYVVQHYKRILPKKLYSIIWDIGTTCVLKALEHYQYKYKGVDVE